MKLPKRCLRATLSLALVLAVTTVFNLRSFAAVEINNEPNESAFVQECTGTLTVKDGSVTVNGNTAQTGATVTNGSVIATASNGRAEIDFGGAGRLVLGRGTTITVDCAGGALSIRSNCSGKTEIEVGIGTADVTSPTAQSIATGNEASFDGPTAFGMAAGSVVEVDCEGSRRAAGAFIGPGLVGILALLGIGTAVAVGIAIGEGDTDAAGRPPVSGA